MKEKSLMLILLCLAGLGLDAGEIQIAVPQTPPARVKLTGIAVLPPTKWALLEIQEYGQPAQQFALAEGSRRITLEVVEVDRLARWVMVRQASVLIKLAMENSVPVSSIPAPNVDGEHVPLPLLPPVGAGDP